MQKDLFQYYFIAFEHYTVSTDGNGVETVGTDLIYRACVFDDRSDLKQPAKPPVFQIDVRPCGIKAEITSTLNEADTAELKAHFTRSRVKQICVDAIIEDDHVMHVDFNESFTAEYGRPIIYTSLDL